MSRYLTSALVLAGIFSVTAPAFADSDFDYSKDNNVRNDDSGQREYLPGEEVQTESGKKMRVWSTKGPVAVNTEPLDSPGAVSGGQQLPPGIIVDDRRIGDGVRPLNAPVLPRVPR